MPGSRWISEGAGEILPGETTIDSLSVPVAGWGRTRQRTARPGSLVCLVYCVSPVERNQINQIDQRNEKDQMDQTPATRCEVLDGTSSLSFFFRYSDGSRPHIHRSGNGWRSWRSLLLLTKICPLLSRGETSTPFLCESALSHRCPDFLCVLTCKRHVILCGRTALEIEVQQSSSKVCFSDEVEIDRNISATFFIFYFDKPHNSCLLL